VVPSERGAAPGRTVTTPKKVLVVSGDRPSREDLGKPLGEVGYWVETAADILQAIRQVREGPVGIVIIDLDLAPLGALTGWDFVRILRVFAPASAIIVVTAEASATAWVHAREWEVAAVLEKPIRIARLKAIVKDLLGEPDSKVGKPSEPSRKQAMNVTTLSSIAEVLTSLANRNTLHARVTLGIMVIFGVCGVGSVGLAFSTQGLERLVMLVGGGLFITMILLLYHQIQNLQEHRMVMEMVVALIVQVRDKATAEKLNELMEKILGQIAVRAARTDPGDGPLEDILGFVRRLESRQRRSFVVTTVGLLVVVGLAGVILGRSYAEFQKTTVGVPVRGREPERSGTDLERVRGLTPQAQEETYPLEEGPEAPGEQWIRAIRETQEVNGGAAIAKQEPPADPVQLVALQRQVAALQREVSAARQELQRERQKEAVPGEETGASGQGAGELQRRIDGLETTLAEHEYLRLVNEALAYTYRNEPGDAERAETAYKTAIRIAQGKSIRHPVAYSAYAAFLQEQSRFPEAEQFYQMALELNPRYGRALYNLGTLYELTGRLKDALQKYKAADEAGEVLGTKSFSRLQSLIN